MISLGFNKIILKVVLSTFKLMVLFTASVDAQINPEIQTYKPFTWRSEKPQDCPFNQSDAFSKIYFSGIKSGFRVGDTWYPTWAEDDKLYSPFTDGLCPRLDGGQDLSISDGVVDFGYGAERTSTGNAVMEGDDPTTLTLYSLGLSHASALPHHGRYPDGSLIHNGVRYYGTYCLDPAGQTKYGNTTYN